MRLHTLLPTAGLPLLLAACISTPVPPPVAQAPGLPAQWQAALPHEGKLENLAGWWQRRGDALLVRLIEAAEKESPSLAAAAARLEAARATRVAAGAALVPAVDLNASSVRTNQQSLMPMGTTTQGALQASWEIDLFGGVRAGRRAAQARLEGEEAGWHEARVSLAAETANLYYSLRACEKLLAVAQEDAASRATSARLADAAAKAGFQSESGLAMARASAAEGNARLVQQRAACDYDIKALVALTAIDEPGLRRALAEQAGELPQGGDIGVASLPAATLTQRPDVFAAQRAVAAAADDIGQAKAARYPRLGLSGSIGAGSFRSDGKTINTDTWSVGPLSLSLPIFDSGSRAANVTAAEARYAAADSAFRATVRNAVREVEQALVTLAATGARSEDMRVMVEGYRAAFAATEQRHKAGLASVAELEDARRVRLAAESALVGLLHERTAAWIALYRAAGGGWRAPEAQ